MSYLSWAHDHENKVVMWLETEDGELIRILDDEEEIQFHLTPYLKRKRNERR